MFIFVTNFIDKETKDRLELGSIWNLYGKTCLYLILYFNISIVFTNNYAHFFFLIS